MAKLALFLALVLSANVAISQADLSAVILGCSTFPASSAFELACPVDSPSSIASCDAHCQCIHGNVWGQCENRTASDPVGTGFGTELCRCYTTGTRPAWSTARTAAQCDSGLLTNQGAVGLLCSTGSAVCNSDCVCSHGTQSGTCGSVGDRHYCLCA